MQAEGKLRGQTQVHVQVCTPSGQLAFLLPAIFLFMDLLRNRIGIIAATKLLVRTPENGGSEKWGRVLLRRNVSPYDER